MAPLLSFRNVSVEYGDKIVLERVNLSIAERAFVSIVGPSGAGKSTFLRLITGQEAPTTGEILLDGEPIRPEPCPERGVVFQRYSVFPHLNARDNVAFGLECAAAPLFGRLFGKRRRAVLAEAEAMLEAVGLGDSLRAYPAELSGGMQQRLAIAQALIRQPTILMLDEPSTGLAPIMIEEVFATLETIRKRGVSILLVEQVVERTLEFVDYGYLIQGGHIRDQGTPAELIASDAVRKAYLGEAAE